MTFQLTNPTELIHRVNSVGFVPSGLHAFPLVISYFLEIYLHCLMSYPQFAAELDWILRRRPRGATCGLLCAGQERKPRIQLHGLQLQGLHSNGLQSRVTSRRVASDNLQPPVETRRCHRKCLDLQSTIFFSHRPDQKPFPHQQVTCRGQKPTCILESSVSIPNMNYWLMLEGILLWWLANDEHKKSTPKGVNRPTTWRCIGNFFLGYKGGTIAGGVGVTGATRVTQVTNQPQACTLRVRPGIHRRRPRTSRWDYFANS